MSNSRVEQKLDIVMMKLNYLTNLLEYSRQPRSTNYPNPFQSRSNTTNNADEIFEFTFSAPTTNTPNLLSSLLNINPLVPNRRLTHREIMDNTTLFVATTEHTSEMCSISRGNFNEGDIIRKINHCGHMFLSENLENWLTTNNTCPLCRINVVQSTAENNT